MAAAQLLKITYNIENKVTQVIDGELCALSQPDIRDVLNSI